MTQPIDGEQKNVAQQERLIEVWNATRDALQKVARDLKITEEELGVAGRFFNRLGQSGMCPSLLAVCLAMTVIDTRRDGNAGTRQNLEGPFHKAGAPLRSDGDLLKGDPGPGALVLHLAGRVTDAATGHPLAGAVLDFWQADHRGTYDNDGYHLRGIVRSDAEGCYRVRTVVPCDYSEHDGDPVGELFSAMGRHNRRAAHIHLKVHCDGHVPLTTQIFMPNSEYLDSDYVEGAVSPDLTLSFAPHADSQGQAVDSRFDVALKPAAA